MSDLVGGTDSHVDSDESTTTSTDFDHERLPPPGAPGPVADAASRHQEHTIFAKRTLGVSRSPSASTATPSGRRHDKRQKTTAAREDLCCFCSPLATCSPRSCSCAKAGRPCRCCEPGNCGRCANTVAAHNRVIRQENYRRQSGIGARFRQRIGRPLDPPIPLYPVPPLPDADDLDLVSDPTGLSADGSGAPQLLTLSSAFRSTRATRRGTTMSRGWVPTTSTATSRILATAHRATDPLAF
jgi:hypothetical protein